MNERESEKDDGKREEDESGNNTIDENRGESIEQNDVEDEGEDVEREVNGGVENSSEKGQVET